MATIIEFPPQDVPHQLTARAAVEHLGQFSVGRTAFTGSVFAQRQQDYEASA